MADTTASESKDKGIEQDLAGNPGEIYSMGEAHAKEEGMTRFDAAPVASATMQERHKEEKKNQKPEKKPVNDLLYWRLGIGLMIILIVTGVIYFVSRGINWGIKKVASTGQSTVATVPTTVLRSNADPLSSKPTGPVISDKNMVPVDRTGSAYSSTSETGRVAGAATTNPVNRNNNCPDYYSDYYYCEQIDPYTIRPYRTEQEYLNSRSVPRSYSNGTSSYASSYPYPYYSYPVDSRPSASLAANGCPDYEQGNYAYCRWIDKYTYQGYR